MNFKYVFACVLVFFCCNESSAANCELRAAMVDVRDNGVSFDPEQTYIFRSPNPDGSPPQCNLNINATGLPNPRSNILSEIKSPETLFSFTQALEIRSVSLQGDGQIKFMSIDFNSLYVPTFRLDLFISPAPAPARGANTHYYLSGMWITLAADGSYQSATWFTPRLISDVQVPTLNWNWNSIDFGGWGDSMTLTMNTGTETFDIYSYYQGNNPGVFKKPFNPVAKTYGNLGESDLTPQTSFKLGGYSLCGRIPGSPVSGPLCF